MQITVNPDALKREAERIERVANDMELALKGARVAVGLPGLPGYARQSSVAVTDVQRSIAQLRLTAGVLSARCVLAYMAAEPGMGMFRKRLEGFEVKYPKDFMKAMTDALTADAYEQMVGRGTRGLANQLVRAFESRTIRLTPQERATIRRNLEKSDGKLYRQYKGLTRLGVRSMLALDSGYAAAARGIPKVEEQLRKGWLDRRLGAGPIGMTVDVFMQWYDDRDQTLTPEERAGRIGVNVAGGVVGGGAAVAGAALVCVVSAGTLCAPAVAVAFAGATAGNYAAGKINERYLPSDEEEAEAEREKRIEKAQAEFRKLEQWYIDNAKPSPDWIEGRLGGSRATTTRWGDGTSYTTFTRPWDGHTIAERVVYPGGQSYIVYYDEHGDPIKR